ncbi:MAG: peptidase M54 [Deltaproteobacteria bacterium]|nr:peptidase M54 [Deltaproteobacteria bacterium]MBW2069848.1 peptidase M54 [Deltaproteobacteria bacterium]
MGAVGDAVLRIIAANLQAIFHLAVDLLPARATPEFAFSELRRQYHAALILNRLGSSRRKQQRLLAVVNVDLFIPILTHVLGEAQMGGRAAVVSLHRLRERRDGGRVPLETFYDRAIKVAVHEVAHTFDLVHCKDRDCVMMLSTTPPDLDELPMFFCRYCKAFLAESYRRYGVWTVEKP